MSDEITITSTTDSVDEVRHALGMPPETKQPEPTPEKAETPEADSADPEKPEEPAAPKPKPSKEVSDAAKKLAAHGKNKSQSAIEKLTGRVDKLTWEKVQLQSELDKLRSTAGKPVTQEPEKVVAPPAVVAPPPAATFDKPKPNEDDFPTHEEYVEALTDWKAEKKGVEVKAAIEADLQAREAKREQARREADARAYAEQEAAKFNEKLMAARKAHADFDEMIEKSKAVRVHDAINGFIQDSDYGGELLYYLASHPSEVDRINQLSPLRIAAEMGRLEDRHQAGTLFSAGDDDDAPEAPTPKPRPTLTQNKTVPVSNAPKPMPRVNTGGAADTTDDDPEKMSMAEYNAWRDKQLRARGALRR